MTEPSPIVGVIRTPRPWGEAVMPTAEQLADWLAICTSQERVEVAAAAILSGEESRACLQQNHVARIHNAEERLRYLADVAWLDQHTLSWSLEVNPERLNYEDREIYLRDREFEPEEMLPDKNAVLAAEALYVVRCYQSTPVGYLILCASTAAAAVRAMRWAVEAGQ